MSEAATALQTQAAELQHLRADAENPDKGMWAFWNKKAQELAEQIERMREALMAAREVLQEDRDELFDSVTVAGIAATMDEIDRPHVDRMEAILSSIDAALETQEDRE